MFTVLENDFLRPLLINNPLIVFCVILFTNIISLLPVALKTNSLKSILFKNPAFLLGDFFILPFIAGIIACFYQNIINPPLLTTYKEWSAVTLTLSLIITLMAGYKYKLLKPVWILHGMFYLLFVYMVVTFISKGAYYLLFIKDSIWVLSVLLTVVLLISLHQYLGHLYPKKF